MTPRAPIALALLAPLALAACTEDPEVDPGPQVCSAAADHTRLIAVVEPADVLFVIDRSPSMADDRDDMRAQAAEMGRYWDELPPHYDLHFAVVSSDLGADGVEGCDAVGDDALLQRAAACGIDGAFLRDARDGDVPERGRNFTNTYEQTLACLFDLPLSTCPVSQPIAAATRAIESAANAGFRRADAKLYVIVLSDGDDCSLTDPAAVAGAPGDADTEAAVDFRCFARGTTCTPSEPSAGGLHRNCVPRDDLGLVSVERSRELLGAFYPAQMAAWVGSADVAITGPGTRIAPSCVIAGRPIGPAPRLAGINEQLPVGPACGEGGWSGALSRHDRVPLVWPVVCFPDTILDTEPTVAGLQADCTATLLDPYDPEPPYDELAPLLPCSDPALPADAPCGRWVDGADECAGTGPGFYVETRGLRQDVLAHVACATACELP